MARPVISEKRGTLASDNRILLRLKAAWRDGTESLFFTPSAFIEGLIASVAAGRLLLNSHADLKSPFLRSNAA